MGDSRASISGMLAGGQRFTIEVVEDVGVHVYLRDQIMVEARNMLTSLNGSGGTVTLRTSTEDELRAENAKLREVLTHVRRHWQTLPYEAFDNGVYSPDGQSEGHHWAAETENMMDAALAPAADETGGGA